MNQWHSWKLNPGSSVKDNVILTVVNMLQMDNNSTCKETVQT